MRTLALVLLALIGSVKSYGYYDPTVTGVPVASPAYVKISYSAAALGISLPLTLSAGQILTFTVDVSDIQGLNFYILMTVTGAGSASTTYVGFTPLNDDGTTLYPNTQPLTNTAVALGGEFGGSLKQGDNTLQGWFSLFSINGASNTFQASGINANGTLFAVNAVINSMLNGIKKIRVFLFVKSTSVIPVGVYDFQIRTVRRFN